MSSGIPETKIDELESALRKKVENLTGYGDSLVSARKLEQIFRYFDSNGSNTIDYEEFFAAMVRLNFIGVQREIEALFDRYDDNCDGTLDYKEFSQHLFGLGEHIQLGCEGKNVVERVKRKITEAGGANGVRTITKILQRMDANGNNKLERDEVKEGFALYGLTLDDSPYFDADDDGHISITELLRGMRGSMGKERKHLVKQAFQALDKTKDGVVTVEDLLQSYDASYHPDVISGRLKIDEALIELLAVFEGNGPATSVNKKDGQVTWIEFLNYYRDLSAGIQDDRQFELMIRNAWHLSGGEGQCANSANLRVLVTHMDGSQEVVEVKDDLGLQRKGNDMAKLVAVLKNQGVREIARVSLTD